MWEGLKEPLRYMFQVEEIPAQMGDRLVLAMLKEQELQGQGIRESKMVLEVRYCLV